MKKRLYISIAIGVVALAASLVGLQKCDSNPQVIYVDRLVRDTLWQSSDPITLQARTIVRESIVYASDSANAALQDSIASLLSHIQQQQMLLAEYGYMTAVADTTIRQKAVISIGGTRIESEYDQDITLAYDYYPVDEFKLITRNAPVIWIDTTAVPARIVQEDNSLPWWVNALLAVGGLILGVVVKQ